MGANFSSRPARISITAQLSSYEAAVKVDPELQFLDTALQQRTSRAISTLAAGVEFNSLSFDSLREVTGCLLDMNQEVVKVFLECHKDIWNNDELFDLVEDYFKCSLHTLDFCTSLEKCVKRARNSQSIIKEALQLFAKEDAEEVGGEGVFKYAKTIQELELFKAAGDPFDEFFEIFQTVYQQQLVMLEKLQLRKKKLAKRIKTIKAWRKVSSVIFVATFAAVLICSVVAAAIAAPPVASILAAAAAIPIGSMGKWVDSLFKKYQDTVTGDRAIMNSMWVGTRVVIKDLENIRLLVDNFEIQINSLLSNADFALRDHEAVEIVIEEITKKLEMFMDTIDDLGKQADICSRTVGRARTLVLERISKPPSS